MPERKYSAGSSSYRYGFQNQETDPELWGGAVSFKYRVEDPRLVRFFSGDPLMASFPWNSPYAFSENRLIDGREMEGLEVVLMNKDDEHDAAIYKAGTKNTDKSAVHIYAHSTPSNINWGNNHWTSANSDFKAALEKSDVYKNAKEKDKVVVIIHGCRAGRSYYDEQGNYVPSVAEVLSKENKNMTIIAPDERDNFSNEGKELGPVKIKNPANNRADYQTNQDGSAKEGNSDEKGNWNVFKGGKWVGQYDDDYDASTTPGGWDKTFNYTEVKIPETSTTNGGTSGDARKVIEKTKEVKKN